MSEAILLATRARVVSNGQTVGHLEKIASDEYRFSYAEPYLGNEAAVPLSLSLPLSRKSHSFEQLPPFFDNLLMEGRAMRRMSKLYGLDARAKGDRFKLLLLSARDTIGAVEIFPLNDQGNIISSPAEMERGDQAFIYETLQPAYPEHCPVCMNPGPIHPSCSMHLLMSRSSPKIAVDSSDYRRVFRLIPAGSSISGAQDKNLFRAHRGRLTPEIPSTHIIKPEGDYAEMPANEHLTMTIAKRCGFPVPYAGLFIIPNFGLIYIVRRFDRTSKGDRALLEDFAQILKYMEEDKEDGSMEEIVNAINRYCSSPAIEKLDFFRRILFSFLFGNGDMHLKNWSLVYNPETRLYVLSPAYDWLNVRAAMPEEKVEMILPLGGKRKDFTRSDFAHFADHTLGLSSKLIDKCLSEIPRWLSIAEGLCPISAL